MTLIEMLFALIIISMVSLALMQMTLMSMRTNMQNTIRDEAVRVGEARMAELRTLRFTESIVDADLSATGGGLPVADGTVTRNIKSYNVVYTRTRAISDISSGFDVGSKQVTVVVNWTYRGQAYSHGIRTILKRGNK